MRKKFMKSNYGNNRYIEIMFSLLRNRQIFFRHRAEFLYSSDSYVSHYQQNHWILNINMKTCVTPSKTSANKKSFLVLLLCRIRKINKHLKNSGKSRFRIENHIFQPFVETAFYKQINASHLWKIANIHRT